MFFLKKLISGFLMPLPIALILLCIALFFLHKKSYLKVKFLLVLVCFGYFLFSYSPIANRLLFPLEYSYKALKTIPQVNYIVVLGSGHKQMNT